MDKKETTKQDLEKAKRLRNVRASHHLTQEKMAERLDVAYTVYQRMESGRNNITLTHLNKLKQEFHVSSDYILFGEVNDEIHFEYEFEGMTKNEKFGFMVRLLAHLCRVNDSEYNNIIKDMGKLLDIK